MTTNYEIDVECPVCDGPAKERYESITVKYGVENPVDVPVVIPMISCASCKEKFSDYRAEGIIDAEIVRLGLRK